MQFFYRHFHFIFRFSSDCPMMYVVFVFSDVRYHQRKGIILNAGKKKKKTMKKRKTSLLFKVRFLFPLGHFWEIVNFGIYFSLVELILMDCLEMKRIINLLFSLHFESFYFYLKKKKKRYLFFINYFLDC